VTGKPGYRVLPAEIDFTGLTLVQASREFQEALDRLNQSLEWLAREGPAWGTDELGQTFGGRYHEVVTPMLPVIESYRRELSDLGATLGGAASNYLILNDRGAGAIEGVTR
jgi:hypothetical protein